MAAKYNQPSGGEWDELNRLTEIIIGSAIEVHRYFGPGLLESTYESCVAYEITLAGLSVVRQVALPVVYKGIQIDQGYRIDLLVANKVIVEIKAVEAIIPVHEAQVLSYLKHSGKKSWVVVQFQRENLKRWRPTPFRERVKVRREHGGNTETHREKLRNLCASLCLLSALCELILYYSLRNSASSL